MKATLHIPVGYAWLRGHSSAMSNPALLAKSSVSLWILVIQIKLTRLFLTWHTHTHLTYLFEMGLLSVLSSLQGLHRGSTNEAQVTHILNMTHHLQCLFDLILECILTQCNLGLTHLQRNTNWHTTTRSNDV